MCDCDFVWPTYYDEPDDSVCSRPYPSDSYFSLEYEEMTRLELTKADKLISEIDDVDYKKIDRVVSLIFD